jgi:hypothetical protein
MPLGTDGFTRADLDVNIPAIWGEQINDYFRYKLQLASFFIDRSDELLEGGDTIYTPNLSALSTNTKTTNAQVTLGLKGLFCFVPNLCFNA